MQWAVAILVALAVACAPLQRACACVGCGDADADSQVGVTSGPAETVSCCTSQSGDPLTTPGDDQRRDKPGTPGPCDDCPRTCCTPGKLVVDPTPIPRPYRFDLTAARVLTDKLGTPRPAHLDRLQRPPRHAIPA